MQQALDFFELYQVHRQLLRPDFKFNTYRWTILICNHLIYKQKLVDLSLFLIGSILGAAAGIIILVIMLFRIKDLPASHETSKYMKCVDCNCTPNECKLSPSSYACPNCTLNECCCWTEINTSNQQYQHSIGQENNNKKKSRFSQFTFRLG